MRADLPMAAGSTVVLAQAAVVLWHVLLELGCAVPLDDAVWLSIAVLPAAVLLNNGSYSPDVWNSLTSHLTSR
jgi:hypothetical protein